MPAGSSRKRERQYEKIKESQEKEGRSTARAKEIAARTVNKERARTGEAKRSSRHSREDMSSGRRGAQRATHGPQRMTRDQLYEEAKRKNVKGRSAMSKDQLARAVNHND